MIKICIGDVLTELRKLPSESVHCCVTSPPYWGLRDYSRCSCTEGILNPARTAAGPISGLGVKRPDSNCPLCHGTGIIEGVKEHQLGLEKTPEEYVNHLVEVFREVKRVLRDDGVLWLNLGDSYYGSWGNSGARGGGQRAVSVEKLGRTAWENHTERPGSSFRHELLKPKDLIGIPWRVAFALQADGWYLRSDIIWSKPNPMPESVTDRPTKSHEYVFLLTKKAHYFYDQEAIREPHSEIDRRSIDKDGNRILGRVEYFKGQYQHGVRMGQNLNGRNIRTVWEITTQPYPEAHFATFPEELPRRCIKACTSLKGCCPKCGAPWERIVEKNRPKEWEDSGPTTEKEKGIRAISEGIYGGNQKSRSISDIFGRATKSQIKTTGWQPTCECGETKTVPCTVLDPFAGSGTTGKVAKDLGRSSILIELNPMYEDLIRKRIGLGVKNGPLDMIK